MPRRAPPVYLALLLLLLSAGADRRVGNLVYDEADAPAGLEHGGSEAIGDADLRAWAAGRVQATLAPSETLARTMWDAVEPEAGVSAVMGAAVVQGRRGTRVLVAVAIEKHGRADLLYRQVDDPAEAEAAVRGLARLADRVRFAADVPITPPRPQGDRLAGLWTGGDLRWMNGTAYMSWRTWYFRPDGWCFEGDPPAGVLADVIDAAALAAEHPDGLARYEIVGDAVNVTYVNGDTDEIEIGDGLLRDGTHFLGRATLPPDGYRFAGTRSTIQTATFEAGGVGGAAGGSTVRTLTRFRPDGTFTRDLAGGSGFAVPGAAAGGTARSETSAGVYGVRNGTVTLTSTDGTVLDTLPIHFRRDGDDPLAMLWIGGEHVEDHQAPANPLDP